MKRVVSVVGPWYSHELDGMTEAVVTVPSRRTRPRPNNPVASAPVVVMVLLVILVFPLTSTPPPDPLPPGWRWEEFESTPSADTRSPSMRKAEILSPPPPPPPGEAHSPNTEGVPLAPPDPPASGMSCGFPCARPQDGTADDPPSLPYPACEGGLPASVALPPPNPPFVLQARARSHALPELPNG